MVAITSLIPYVLGLTMVSAVALPAESPMPKEPEPKCCYIDKPMFETEIRQCSLTAEYGVHSVYTCGPYGRKPASLNGHIRYDFYPAEDMFYFKMGPPVLQKHEAGGWFGAYMQCHSHDGTMMHSLGMICQKSHNYYGHEFPKIMDQSCMPNKPMTIIEFKVTPRHYCK